MRIKKTFLVEKNNKDENVDTDTSRFDAEKKTVNQQVDQKTLWPVGTAPTSDNLQDYFDNIDRLGRQAR